MTAPAATLPDLVPGTWAIDVAHSEVSFVVRHLMVSKVRGTFERFSSSITVADDVLASTVEATVEMDSITTSEPNRDNHLRSKDFFEVGTHPEMTFRSTSIRPDGDDFVVVGDLTLKGVTREVAFALEYNGASTSPMGTRSGFSATTEINRNDFGVDIKMPIDGGGVVVGEKVKIVLEIEAVLEQPATAGA